MQLCFNILYPGFVTNDILSKVTSCCKFHCCRFEKKICQSAESLPVYQFLVAMLRMRCDSVFADKPLNQRVIKRLCHWWAQACEKDMESHFLSSCPDPTTSAKYHPFSRGARAKGNKSLAMTLISKFQARSGGYVTLRSEDSLKKLGLLSEKSQFASRTALEYCARMLGKTAQFVQEQCEHERVLNFAFDQAMVGQESVPLNCSV